MDIIITAFINWFVQLCVALMDIPFFLGYNLFEFMLAASFTVLIFTLMKLILGSAGRVGKAVSHDGKTLLRRSFSQGGKK